MPLDPGPIARLAADFMDELEEEYGFDAELLRVAVVVELQDGEDTSCVEVASTDLTVTEEREVEPTARAGLMARALHAELLS